MSILYIVDQREFIPGTGIHTYVTNLYQSLKKHFVQASVLVIGDDFENPPALNDPNFIIVNRLNSNLVEKIIFLSKEMKIDICHFHSIFKFQTRLLSELKKAQIKAILTIHNNSLLCYKETMAYNNKHFCDNNSSPIRCVKCISNRHKFGIAIYSLNILNNFIPFSISDKLNYFSLLKAFRGKVKDLIEDLDAIFILDNWVLNYLPKIEDISSKIFCMPQAINLSVQNKKKIIKNVCHDMKLVYLGRTDLTKGLLLLVRSIKAMENVSIDCYIEVTDQNYFKKVVHEVKKNNLKVNFHPLLKHDLLNDTLINYDLLCLPSFSEMAPLLSLESLSIGLPVLASDHPGFSSQAKKNKGITLFKNGNVWSLRDKIIELAKKYPSEVSNLSSYEENIINHKNLYHSIKYS